RGPAAAQQVAAAAPADAPPLAAPSRSETREIVDYLRRHAQRPLSVHDNPRLARDLDTPAGKMFEQACAQCHALPDPRSHTAAEWPAVVHRMERNMLWMNRIVGSRADPREPQLRPSEIIGFLQRHARR
ncbi:MAG TPA: hypothetical protein VM491_09380, partial [Burkholderiaceae bacterium]|nr:hypothetical protein [Burkholderiaceae bacterium]